MGSHSNSRAERTLFDISSRLRGGRSHDRSDCRRPPHGSVAPLGAVELHRQCGIAPGDADRSRILSQAERSPAGGHSRPRVVASAVGVRSDARVCRRAVPRRRSAASSTASISSNSASERALQSVRTTLSTVAHFTAAAASKAGHASRTVRWAGVRLARSSSAITSPLEQSCGRRRLEMAPAAIASRPRTREDRERTDGQCGRGPHGLEGRRTREAPD